MLRGSLLHARANRFSNADRFRQYTQQSDIAHTQKEPRDIAVLGAGLAGLTLTLHLARQLLPGGRHRIVLYDASERSGGWVRSDRVDLKGKGRQDDSAVERALVEAGPRSIRPAALPGLAMLHLIKSLGLADELICVPKTHASAKNRFLYYAGKIHLLPSSIGKALRILLFDRGHPLSKAKIPSTLWRGILKKREKSSIQDRWSDESIENFLRRRFGRKEKASALPLLDYVGSAVLHGIYAADASKLSVRSIFGFLWNADLVHGSPARAALPPIINRQHLSLEMLAERESDANAQLEITKRTRLGQETNEFSDDLGIEYVAKMNDVSVVSFPNGVQTLTDAIVAECRRLGVEMALGCKIDRIELGKDHVHLSTAKGDKTFDRLISALPSPTLDKILSNKDVPNLSSNSSSTVAVLNIAIPSSLEVRIPEGFGYLVPRACAQEGDNPLGLLGVVFDSVAVPGQDSCTKLTMMMGGPFWKQGYAVFDLLDTDNEAALLNQALSTLSRHLCIDKSLLEDERVFKRITLQKDCIVTYTPGHLGRMAELDAALQRQKSLTVIGASYTGVSLNDCVLNATRTAKRLVKSELGRLESVTGLEELVRE